MSTVPSIDDDMPTHVSSWPLVFNLANSIIGVAVLALPFCFKECGVVLGLLLMLSSAWLTDVACRLLVKTASLSKKRSYEYLALHIFGVAGKFTVEISIIGMLLGSCIAFYIIIGDLSPAIISKLTGLENTSRLRTILLVLATVFGVLPLGMLRSIDSLGHFSAVSLTFYVVFALHVISSAFTNFWSGVWLSKVVYWNLGGIFKCLPIFALSFACQTQLFVIYDALPDPSLKHMNSIIRSAVMLCGIVYFTVGFFGYVAFCDNEISGDVLMNFRPTLLSEVIKLGFVISTVISFPLVIFPCRASIYTLFFSQKHCTLKNVSTYIPPLSFKMITVAIVLFTLSVGIAVPNVEFMLSITGATMGSLICFVLPALMTVTTVTQNKQKYQAQFVLFVGVTILLASTYVTMMTQEKLVRQKSVIGVPQPIGHRLNNDDTHKFGHHHKLLHEMRNGSIAAQQQENIVTRRPNDNILVERDVAVPVLNSVKEDTRKEPPNPLELPDNDVDQKRPTNFSQLHADAPPAPAAAVLTRNVSARSRQADNSDGHAAVDILAQLRRQQLEQKQLINEQREIVNELRRHENIAHHELRHWQSSPSLSRNVTNRPTRT